MKLSSDKKISNLLYPCCYYICIYFLLHNLKVKSTSDSAELAQKYYVKRQCSFDILDIETGTRGYIILTITFLRNFQQCRQSNEQELSFTVSFN
jgi:CHASE3 domain sensor protein